MKTLSNTFPYQYITCLVDRLKNVFFRFYVKYAKTCLVISYRRNIFNTSFVLLLTFSINLYKYGVLDVFHEYLKDVFFYAMEIFQTSFVRYECLKDVISTLWMSFRRLLYVRLLYVMDVSKMSYKIY